MSDDDVAEVTELAGQQSLFRELVRSAFAARLGDVAPACDCHGTGAARTVEGEGEGEGLPVRGGASVT
ncbi:hypothetical protein [Gemmatimonas sp.]|uniref:hypothetical protein n=1 Tax=Gemmatimonas sp. TaxID=1962908 RepID=UPI0022BC0521|nr:hypothetical protein [Gemmatimonas sp.]MCZ8203579.1 hypothetical protein [Gemmatimonas sp.]